MSFRASAPPPAAAAPTGSLLWFMNAPGLPGVTQPQGYTECDGSAISRTTYAALFGVIGTTYGAGDGVTTFNVPDFRSRFPLGRDGAGRPVGSTGGNEIASPSANFATAGPDGGFASDGGIDVLNPYMACVVLIKT